MQHNTDLNSGIRPIPPISMLREATHTLAPIIFQIIPNLSGFPEAYKNEDMR